MQQASVQHGVAVLRLQSNQQNLLSCVFVILCRHGMLQEKNLLLSSQSRNISGFAVNG